MHGRIDVQEYDTDELEAAIPDWNSRSAASKLDAIRNTDAVQPQSEETVYNVTVERFHEYMVDNLDPSQTASKDNITTLWLGLGTDAAGGTNVSDTDLNSRQFEKNVTDTADNGTSLLASTFVDSTEANGNTYDELGLFSGDPNNLGNNDVFLLNHATFSDVSKDSSNTVTFDVTLQFSDV